MILYHGTNLDIASINLNMCRPYKDFGKGFYLTLLEEQARKMAYRVSKVDDNLLSNKELSIKNFGTEITEEWAAFVMNNRNRNFTDFENALCNFDFKYDIVMGPIANDDLAMLFREYSKHAINLDVLLKELSYKEATNQVSFHTERAIGLLRKIGVIHG